ncbi:hypothetical protein UlMin_016120 [Ulmus minor]
MDAGDSNNGDSFEDLSFWWVFFGMFYQLLKKRQRAIRYNSILTGDDRVTEFLHGHWERIFNRTRMTRDCFVRLSSIMEQTGRLTPSRAVSVEEQLMIFLFVVGHGASNRDAQETWQRSGSTISKYFGIVLEAIFNMSGEYIRPPDMNNVHHTIRYNNRFFPYFQGCVGAIDGTHVSACVGGARADKFRGRKGDTTWNVLAACDFDLKFTYMLSGWEGSAHDARVLEHVISEPQNGFPFPPPGKYYLVDSGYANRGCFLAPYRGTNYHLRDRRRLGGDRKKEQFNYRHASLRNAIERTFGIWKRRFPILRSMHQFPLDKQAMIPVACAVLHNFIRMDPASVAQDHVSGDEDDDDASSEDDSVDADPDGVDVGESSSHLNIPHDMDMGAFRDYVTNCIHEGSSG